MELRSKEELFDNQTTGIENENNQLYFSIQEKCSLKIIDVINLVKNPPKFFEKGVATKHMYIKIAFYLSGIAHAIEAIDKYILKEEIGISNGSYFSSIAMSSWIVFWSIVMVIGFFSSIGIWCFQGWWYNVRLKWCSESVINKSHGRIVFIFNKMIYVIPFIVITFVEMFLFSNHYEAYYSEGVYAILSTFLPLSLLILSIINSYRTVINVFELKKAMAMLLFLVLPLSIYGFLIFISILA